MSDMKTCGLRLQRCSFFKDVGNANDRWRVKGWNGIRETFDCTVAGFSLHGVEIFDLIFWWISWVSTRFSSRTHSEMKQKVQKRLCSIESFRMDRMRPRYITLEKKSLRISAESTGSDCDLGSTISWLKDALWQLTDCFWLWIELSFLASFSTKKTS